MAFWQGLSPTDQMNFERTALDNAEPTNRTGYSRHQGKGGRLFEQYRQVILRDHFERTTLVTK